MMPEDEQKLMMIEAQVRALQRLLFKRGLDEVEQTYLDALMARMRGTTNVDEQPGD